MGMNVTWETILLRDICQNVQYGHTASATDEPIGPKFLRITDIVPETIDWPSVPYCEIEHKKKNKYLLKKGDIVIARTGATTGFAKYIKAAPESIFASYLVRLQLINGVDPRYVGYVVESDAYKEFIQTNWGGAAQPNANAQILTSFLVPMPPLSTQHKIVAILSAYDDLIENNLRRIKILEEMAQNLYREWFVKFRFPGHKHAHFADSPLGRIPEGWSATTIGNAASYISRGLSPKYDDSSSSVVINQKCIRDHKLNLGLVRRHSGRVVLDKYVRFGDILINSTGIGTLGRVAQVYVALSDATVDTHVSIVRPQNSKDIDYLGLALLGMESHFESLGAGATGQTELRRDRISETDIIFPPLDLRKDFSTMVAPIRRLGISLFSKNTTLRRTRDLLLPRLISGEVDVSELDISKLERVIS